MALFSKEIQDFMDIVNKLELLSPKEQDLLKSYFQEFIDHKLYVTLYDRKHDVNHVMRVALYVHILCNRLKVETKYYDMVMMAAIYHDTGLDRDKSKIESGLLAAKKFEECNKDNYEVQDLEIIKRIIALYNDKSDELDFNGLGIKLKADMDKVKQIYFILKDADAIDRNRMDYSFAKCKPRYLRLSQSKSLMEIADKVLFEFKKIEFCNSEYDDEDKFSFYYKLYVNYIKKYLPVRDEVIKNKIKDNDVIEKKLGSNASELFRIPNLVFYGCLEYKDVLKTKKDNNHLIAYEGPLQAFFVSLFSSPLEVITEIDEHFTENGEYKVEYIIDELVKGALDNYINDTNIVIYVLDGNLFYKPTGSKYLSRDWYSRSYRDICPLDSFTVNVKKILKILEDKKVVTYKKWNEDKVYPSIINLLSQNYIENYTSNEQDLKNKDVAVDNLVKSYYSGYEEFVNFLRTDLKTLMAIPVKEKEKDLTEEQVLIVRKKEARGFITGTFTELNDSKERVFSKTKVDNYLEIKKNPKKAKSILKEQKKHNKTAIKLETIEDVNSSNINVKESIWISYAKVIGLSAFIGVILGGLVAVFYLIIF